MPYKSTKQRKYMHWAAEHGKISKAVVEEFDKAEKRAKQSTTKKSKPTSWKKAGKHNG